MNKDNLLLNYKDLKLKYENLKAYNKTNFLNCNEEKMKRLRSKENELEKKIGYRFAMQRLLVHEFQAYTEVLKLMDFVFLNHKKVDLQKATIYFSKLFPNIRICYPNHQGDRERSNVYHS